MNNHKFKREYIQRYTTPHSDASQVYTKVIRKPRSLPTNTRTRGRGRGRNQRRFIQSYREQTQYLDDQSKSLSASHDGEVISKKDNTNFSELYPGTLIKFVTNDELFGEVVTKHHNGTYTVEISDACRWYQGTKYLSQISRTQLRIAQQSQSKHMILQKELKRTDKEEEIYVFLGEFGDLYIDAFLSNGITRMDLLLLLEESDLKELNVEKAHRRFIAEKTEKERYKRSNLNNVQLSPARVRLVIFDFDQTITVNRLYHPLFNSDQSQESILEGMTDESVVKLFGGHDRLKRLIQHFKHIKERKIDLAIIAYSFVVLMKAALKKANLYTYFSDSKIIGCDSREWRDAHGSKVKCIQNVFRKELKKEEIVFVDDDRCDIQRANELSVCATVLIERREGMTKDHIDVIEEIISI